MAEPTSAASIDAIMENVPTTMEDEMMAPEDTLDAEETATTTEVGDTSMLVEIGAGEAVTSAVLAEVEEAPSFDELKAASPTALEDDDDDMVLDSVDEAPHDEESMTKEQLTPEIISGVGTESSAETPEPPSDETATVAKSSTDIDSALSSQGYASAETLKLIEMLRSDDVSDRVTAVAQLETIAAALGHERTRSELIPFLTESTDDDDDVLIVMAEKLERLTEYIGGEEHYKLLLSPLEMLLMVEETTVRDKAIESCLLVSKKLPSAVFQGTYAEMLKRLANKEWYTARMSACTLIATDFEGLGANQRQENLESFAKLCRDDVPMVRRTASHNLGLMLTNALSALGPSSIIEPDGLISRILLPLYEELAQNDQDSVRLQTTENCIAFGKAITALAATNENTAIDRSIPFLQQEELVERILPILVSTTDDRSWRVRWTAASKFNEAVQAFSALPGAMAELVSAYEKLLQDPEAEVKTAATFNLADVAKYAAEVEKRDSIDDKQMEEKSEDVAERLVKRVSALTDDETEHVRAALAMVATELAPILGKNRTINHLLPPILLLLRDSSSEVRLNLISSLGPLNDVIGLELLSQSLLPAIIDLSEDSKWRIRLAVITHIPLLAEQLGQDFFSEKLSALCVAWLGDDISSIREAAAKNLMELTGLFGSKWAIENLLTSLMEIRHHQSYLRRLTAVQSASLMTTKMEADIASRQILPLVLEMASDAVPNIRFNVAKALERMAVPCGETVYRSQIRPVLAVLTEDPDRDVRYFAEKSLEDADKHFHT